MGKVLICFLLLFFISIHKIDSILTFRHYNIQISNQIAGNKKLMINCRAAGFMATEVKFLPFNTVWLISFTVFPRTLIWCDLWKGNDYVQYATFDAFIAKESFLHDVCGGRKPNVCYWQAREDGIYVRNNAVGTLKFMYKWETQNSTNILF
ncbi:hypothetical protein CARUB_v10002956mg [Capsella rubella]|uniref:S-protein homolog n=1 Tax=Capsella rubella TaxID=81985 RepID=R0GZH2_9BRAS|nr:S-protein homolog 21 [Capsella rubella]EOA22339.1 hypothetical protein CARUB_v10002956mg [Capsella rubella]